MKKGSKLYHNAKSVVRYLQPGQIPVSEDIKNFAVRRSEGVCYASIKYIRKKWNIELAWDHYDSYFLIKNLKNNAIYTEKDIHPSLQG